MAIQVSISPEGQITLPASMRANLDVVRGGKLVVEEVENGLLLRSVAQAIGQAQAINRKHAARRSNASVDAFLAGRKTDSGE